MDTRLFQKPIFALASGACCLLWACYAPAAKPAPARQPRSAEAQLKTMDPFFKQHVIADGLLIAGSEKVSKYALDEVAYLARKVLANRPELLKQFGRQISVMAYTEMQNDLPDCRGMDAWWNYRARGVAGSAISCGEENVLSFKGDPWQGENIFIHEFAHGIHGVIQKSDKGFATRLNALHAKAKESGLFRGYGIKGGPGEFWAEGVQAWYNCNGTIRPKSGGGQSSFEVIDPKGEHVCHITTREHVKTHLPGLAKLLDESFRQNKWLYVPVAKRLDEPHLRGFDPGRAPTFRWPPGVEEAFDAKEKANALQAAEKAKAKAEAQAKSRAKAAPKSKTVAGEKGIVFRKDVFVRGRDGYHTYRIPTMVVTGKGTILVFCEGRKRSRQDGGDVDTLMKRSVDGGKTWSKQVLIHEEGGDAPIRVGNPCPIVERNGKVVHLLFTRGGGECLYYTRSTDEGKTWSKLVVTSDVPGQKEYTKTSFLRDFGGSPVRIAAGPVHGIQTKKGRLIAPSYVGRTVDSKPRGQSCIIYSDDGGKTWRAGGVVPLAAELGTGECTVVERSDGSLLMNMRTNAPGKYAFGYRTLSTSTDDGATWSKPVVDKTLPCPACQASIIRLNDREILFLNPAVHREGGFHLWSRKNLTLRLSRDDGRTWPHCRVLNEGLAGYSDMAVTKEGRILCLFENGKKDYCENITIVEVNRAWLAAGKNAQPPLPEKAQK